MLLRRGFFRWMIPAAFVLPLWLLVGWAVFSGAAFGYLWVVVLVGPAFFVCELLLTLLVRARGTVRAQRAVSWWDVAGFSLWHLATIAVGFYQPVVFGIAMLVAILALLGVAWSSLWQLWNEARGRTIAYLREAERLAATPAGTGWRAPTPGTGQDEVYVITETASPPPARPGTDADR